MNIEIVEFYILERNDEKKTLKGSLHVYLCDLDIDLRGISVMKNKDFWYFLMPARNGIDPDTKKKVWFPLFSFTCNKKTKALRTVIIEKGKIYIEKMLKEEKKEGTL